MNEPVRKPVLKASEVAQFCYCSVAWHLQRQGYKPESPALEIGVERHKNLGGQIDTIFKHEKLSNRLKWSVIALLVIAVLLSVYLFTVVGLVAISIFYYLILFIMLVCGVITSFSRREYRRAKRIRDEHGIPEGKIVYTDLDKPAEPIFSKTLWLVGKPDYIVKDSVQYVPVEVKISVTDEPYRSHVMQLASYCLLLEEKYNQGIPFGVIAYGDGRQFKIPFTSDLKTDIIDTLEKMRLQLRAKVIERNHNSSAKCEACSFKKHCTQIIE